MRIPQDRPSGPQPPGRRTYEEDLSLRYLSPGAFTVLPPGRDRHDPPPAPQPYRLTPNSRRRREQAFSIIAEPTSNPGSRSPSPSGRVSPFRGRGFNPAGSRHASPAPSPPPHAKTKPPAPHHQHQPRSKIPKLTRRGSEQYFGDRISPPEDARLSPKPLSQSMTNLTETSRRRRPPQSPRRKPPPFQQLSPIVGSSPEAGGEKGVRAGRSRSGGDSPGRVGGSPARKGGTGYRNVQAKVNSYSRMVGKPKVPVKPEGLGTTGNTDSSTSTEQGNRNMKNRTPVSSRKNEKPQLMRRESDKKLNAQKNNSNTNNQNNNNNNRSSSNNKNNNTNNNNINNKTYSKIPTSNGNNSTSTNNNNGTTTTTNNNKTSNLKNSESVTKLADLLPSTTTVVSTTTTTVTKPLKIDANVEERLKMTTNGEKVAPIVDGRILSATSVSNAINRMNDTVLDSQTVIKEHNFSKLSPAASAIISLSNEEYKTKTLESRQKGSDGLTGQQKTVGGGGGGGVGVNGGSEMGSKVTGNNSNGSSFSINSNNTSMSGTDRQNVAVRQNSNHTGMTNTLNHGSSTVNVMGQGTVVAHGNMGNNNHKIGMSNNNSIERNQRHMETRNVIAADVQPLRITVKEKAPNVEVQSGNIRYPGPTANGISEIPSLPPPEPDNPQSEPQKPKNCCSRFFTGCRRKLPCGCCQKPKSASEKKLVDRNEDKKQTGCFTCTKGTKEDAERVKDATKKSSCWDRIKCCGKNKVGDKMTGCCPRGKRRTSWIDQREQQENLEQEAASKRCCSCCNKKACGGFFRRMFCCCCKKKKMEDPVSRRESMLSKKKSLSSTVPPPEMKPKLDLSLVEHASHMKGAIPVLPVKLAWFCLICNIFLPGIGTIFSGMFCLCIGIPRFSQKDGPKPRIGAFIIDLIIGCGQLFTVLFCLVGWGWSIWWGLIMLKIAKKHQKLLAQEDDAPTSLPANQHHQMRDVERGAT